jgi:YfiH family protein
MSITNIKIGTLEYLAADGICVAHGFTTRYGGVSQGYLGSLNLGLNRGDDRENVVKNYEILGNALGFDPQKCVLSRQTHTNTVRVVGKTDWGTGLFRPGFDSPCDALITNEPGTVLVVFTADCTPVLFWDPVTGAVGAAHAGWRGTAADIVGETIRAMAANFGCDPQNIRCAIGPNIGQCHFETDADVPDAIVAALGDIALPYITKRGEKYYVNLKEINALFLRRAGAQHIEISTECTVCECEKYWSHRVVGQNRGSQGALILCKEECP